MTGKFPIKLFNSVVNSYAMVFFSREKIFGMLLILVTFFDPVAGFSGLWAVLVSNFLAWYLGYDRLAIEQGTYGFNAMLVGLGLGIFYIPNFPFLVLLTFGAVITFLITILAAGILGKYQLPFLSIPFLLALWSLVLASRNFAALGISERGVYLLNELYATGNNQLVNIYLYFNQLSLPDPLKIYLRSLGAILFQFNLLSGLLIAIGLLIFSRIAFLLSMLSFLTAYYFYYLLGADITVLSYNYIGFNFILSGIAVGGYYLIPSRHSFLWTVLLVPALVIITSSMYSVFTFWQLGIYSLPFNVVVITFLYVVKLRHHPSGLEEVVIQHYAPEKNLYQRLSNGKRYFNYRPIAIDLPVFGQWYIDQAHYGELTHRGDWAQAWDFVIVDKNDKQYKNEGLEREDYYCYNKPVVAPADGTVEEIINYVDDNLIGDSNLNENWGNSLVIKHDHQLYSQLSHLKKDSFQVKKGDQVKKGEILAYCGNSGRSPVPHLHFQIQSTPYVGSKTLDYPLSHYMTYGLKSTQFYFYDYPEKGEKLSSIQTTSLLDHTFKFLPGQILKFQTSSGRLKHQVHEWEVQTDYYNNTCFFCHTSNSKAYFVHDGKLFYFTHFEGKRSSLLYFFYLAAFKVVLTFAPDLVVEDEIPLHLYSRTWLRKLQDFIAPFFPVLQARYALKYKEIDDDFSPSVITLQATTWEKLFSRKYRMKEFQLRIEAGTIQTIIIKTHDNQEVIAKCIK